MSDIENAAAAARAAVIAEAAPRLVDAAAHAYSGDRLGSRRFDALLSNVDPGRLVDEHGVVDTARLHALVDAVGGATAPANPVDGGQGPRAPADGF